MESLLFLNLPAKSRTEELICKGQPDQVEGGPPVDTVRPVARGRRVRPEAADLRVMVGRVVRSARRL
jgi:hypothetical protein